MSFNALYLTIAGDLCVTHGAVDGGEGFYPTIAGHLRVIHGPVDGGGGELTRTDCAEEVLVALVPDGAGYGVGEAEGHAQLLARSPTAMRLLREVLSLFAAEFEADEDVPGADLVERFAEWRGRALAELIAPIQPVDG